MDSFIKRGVSFHIPEVAGQFSNTAIGNRVMRISVDTWRGLV